MVGGNNNKADTEDSEAGMTLGHWRLETCLPEVRLPSPDVEPPSLKPVPPVPPVPPPKPANIRTKLLEYKQARAGLTDSVNLTNTDRDRPQKEADSSRLQSKIPILKGSRIRLPLKTENFPHKICLKIENSRVEEEPGGHPAPSLGGSCSGRTTPASLLPRPCLSLPGMSGRSTPVRRWLHQSRDSLEVEWSQILMFDVSISPQLVRCQRSLAGPPRGCVNPGHYSGGWSAGLVTSLLMSSAWGHQPATSLGLN